MFVDLRGRQRRALILLVMISLNIVCSTAGPNQTGNNSPVNQKEVNNTRVDDLVRGDSMSDDESLILQSLNTFRNGVAQEMKAKHMNKLAWSNALKETAEKKVDSITATDYDIAGICYWADIQSFGQCKATKYDKATKVGCALRPRKVACAFDVAYKGGTLYEAGTPCEECKCDDYYKGLCSNMAAVPKASLVLLFAGSLASLFMA